MKNKLIQLYFQIDNIWRTYVLHQEDCDNCAYYSGVACNHVDKDGKCLGWRNGVHPIMDWKYKRKMKKLRKRLAANIRKAEREIERLSR